MSGRFRFRNRKANKDPDNETASLSGFDEQGFLCPDCYQKFSDSGALAQHYAEDHAQPKATKQDETTNDSKQKTSTIDPLKQEKQRVKDLESDIELLQRQLRLAQMKLSEQNSSQIFDRFFEKCSTFEIDSNEKTSKIFDEFENLQKIIRFVRDQNASFSRNFRFFSEKLTNELRLTKNENVSLRRQIENLNGDLQQLEMTISMYKKEHLRLMDTTERTEDEQTTFLRKLTEEKNFLDEQNKDFRQQIKTLQQQNEDETNRFSRQILQITSEKNRLDEEIRTLKTHLNRNENEREHQKKEFEQWKISLTKQIEDLENEKYAFKQTNHQNERLITDLRFQLKTFETEKFQNENFQSQLTQMKIQFHKKDAYIRHLTTTIHRCLKLAQRVQKSAVEMSETNFCVLLDQIDWSLMKSFVDEFSQSFHQIQNSIHQREKRFNDEKLLLRQQIRDEYRQIVATNQQQKEQIERLENQIHQLIEVKRNFEDEREKRIGLENELELRSKRHDMQLTALKDNLATVRTELKTANERLVLLEPIKTEKNDLEARLVVSQDERRVLLERSLASESKNEKLLNENGQLSRKIVEIDAALQEMARENQVVKMQMTKLSQRRWLNDDDIHACMKCHQTFSITQRKHHCRSCGNIFCDPCSSKNAVVAASSKKPQRVCDQCYKDLTS